MFSAPPTAATAATAGGSSLHAQQEVDVIACAVENRGRTVAIATMSPSQTHLLQTYIVQDTQSYGGACAWVLENCCWGWPNACLLLNPRVNTTTHPHTHT